MLVIITQILTILSNYMAAWSTKKSNIILCRASASLFNALSLLLVGNVVGAIPVFFTIVRDIVCFVKEKFKTSLPLYLVCVGYIIIALLTIPYYQSILDILPVAVSLVASVILWNCDSVGIKLGIGVGDTLWMIYDFYNGLYLSALNILLQLVLSAISIIKIKVFQNNKTQEEQQ